MFLGGSLHAPPPSWYSYKYPHTQRWRKSAARRPEAALPSLPARGRREVAGLTPAKNPGHHGSGDSLGDRSVEEE